MEEKELMNGTIELGIMSEEQLALVLLLLT
jgi:hypothetical protein